MVAAAEGASGAWAPGGVGKLNAGMRIYASPNYTQIVAQLLLQRSVDMAD